MFVIQACQLTLLGHKSARITTHYSSAELLNLWKAANTVCDERSRVEVILLNQPFYQVAQASRKAG